MTAISTQGSSVNMIIEKIKSMIRGERQDSELSSILTRLHKVEERMRTAEGSKLEELTAEKERLDARFRQILNERRQSIEARPELSQIEHRRGKGN